MNYLDIIIGLSSIAWKNTNETIKNLLWEEEKERSKKKKEEENYFLDVNTYY